MVIEVPPNVWRPKVVNKYIPSDYTVGNFPGGYVQGLPLPLLPLIISPAAGAV